MIKNPEMFGEFQKEVLGHEPEPVEYDPLFQELEQKAHEKRDETLEEELETLKEDCLRYLETILRSAIFSRKLAYDPEQYREGAETVDRTRHQTHEVVIDDVNILSRMFNKAGLDNSWREKLPGREAIEEWAIKIALGELSQEFETQGTKAA